MQTVRFGNGKTYEVGKLPFGALCDMVAALRDADLNLAGIFDGELQAVQYAVKKLFWQVPDLVAIALASGGEYAVVRGLTPDELRALPAEGVVDLLEAFLKESPVDDLLGKAKNLLGLAAGTGPQAGPALPGTTTPAT